MGETTSSTVVKMVRAPTIVADLIGEGCDMQVIARLEFVAWCNRSELPMFSEYVARSHADTDRSGTGAQ